MTSLHLKVILSILIVTNLFCLITYWYDKSRARKKLKRISEIKLLQLSFMGPLGSVLGIWFLRHKSNKINYLLKYFFVVTFSAITHIFVGYLFHSYNE